MEMVQVDLHGVPPPITPPAYHLARTHWQLRDRRGGCQGARNKLVDSFGRSISEMPFPLDPALVRRLSDKEKYDIWRVGFFGTKCDTSARVR